VAGGVRPGLIHAAIANDMRTNKNLRVSINGVKKYIYRHKGNWVDASTIGWTDIQRLIGPSATVCVMPNHMGTNTLGPKPKSADNELGLVEEWWEPLTIDGKRMFTLAGSMWSFSLSKVIEPDPSSVGFLQYMAAALYGRSQPDPELDSVSDALQELARLLTSKVRFSLMSDFSPILKGVMGFSVSFNRRDRGMNELQQFQKLPRWWRREVQVAGTMSGLFIPLGLEWSAEQTSTVEFGGMRVSATPPEREWAFEEEIEFWKRQQRLTSKEAEKLWKVVPPEYSRLVRDKDALTKGIYWKKF